MSKIILLNGCGSSGKTTISESIQHLSDEPWLHIGVNNIIDLVPSRFMAFGDKTDRGYYKFIPDKNERGSTIKIECTEKGARMFEMLPKFAKQLADLDENVIIDEVMIGKSSKDAYFKILKPHKIYFIGVYCDLDVMKSREILRGNRCVGLANAQSGVVHENYKDIYDLKVDTTKTPPFELAKKILNFTKSNKFFRAAWINGSRVNPNVTNDEFQDYEIVFVVNEIKLFIGEDKSWIFYFDEVVFTMIKAQVNYYYGSSSI